MHPKSEGFLESSLYVNDVAVSARFYEKIFGFRTYASIPENAAAQWRPATARSCCYSRRVVRA